MIRNPAIGINGNKSKPHRAVRSAVRAAFMVYASGVSGIPEMESARESLPACGGGCGAVSYSQNGNYHSKGCYKTIGVIEKQVERLFKYNGAVEEKEHDY